MLQPKKTKFRKQHKGRIHGLAKGDEKFEMAKDLLERVGLQRSYVNRYPHEFSGGQRQRIVIVRGRCGWAGGRRGGYAFDGGRMALEIDVGRGGPSSIARPRLTGATSPASQSLIRYLQ